MNHRHLLQVQPEQVDLMELNRPSGMNQREAGTKSRMVNNAAVNCYPTARGACDMARIAFGY